jgi:hypothetical protein
VRQGMTVGGRYQLVRSLVGSQSTELWLALELPLNRHVVLKRLLADGAESRRLRAEARALAAFNNPHVVTLYGIEGEWLVMEYVPGGNLEDRRKMPPEDAARVGAQVAGALAAMHDEHIVHLDVKPANIVDTGHGVVKLADFGAAYRVGGRDTITANGAISYTLPYAAPEVIMGRPETKSDVFSLGATIYALVAGDPPCRGAGDEGADEDVAWEVTHSDVTLTADVGPLEGLLREMLELDPRKRPRMQEVQKRFAEIARPGGAVYDDGRRGRMGLGRGTLLIVAAAACVAVAAGAVITNEREKDRHPATSPPTTFPHTTPTSSIPAGSGPAVSTGSARLFIGDSRTADPCAMTDLAALERFGRTELDTDYGGFDRCDVIVYLPGRGSVDVMADLNQLAPPEQGGKPRIVGRVAVLDNPVESGECSRTLVLPGVRDTTVRVRAQWEDEGRADLCEIADAAATVAARKLDRGPLKRRSLPAGSLAQRDACALLSGKALEAIPGVDATEPDTGFGGWDCKWNSTTSDTSVSLTFDRDQPPTADDGTATRINGYRAFLQPEGDGDRTCLLQVVYRPYIDQNGQTAVEKVRIVVGGSRPMHRLCEMATALARSATSELRDT